MDRTLATDPPDHGRLRKLAMTAFTPAAVARLTPRIQEIADYCKSDVINTYRLWLRHELFRGRLDQNQFEFSEADVVRLI